MTYPMEDVGSITASWVDANGTIFELTNTDDALGWFTPPGPSGWDATTYEIVTDPIPRGGEQIRFIRAKPARIVWPLYVYGDTHLAYLQRRRTIKKAFMSTLHKGRPGVLTVARPDSDARQINCFYESGLEGETGDGWLYSKDAVTLYAPDGYWQEVDATWLEYGYIPGVNFLAPYPQVSNSLNLGQTVVNNHGDIAAWPTWIITGPMTAITATNVTTGYEWTLTYPLNAGEQITVTTYQPTVRGPAAQNLTGFLDWPLAYLWWLDPGDNYVIMNLSGGQVGTTIDLTFNARFEGA